MPRSPASSATGRGSDPALPFVSRRIDGATQVDDQLDELLRSAFRCHGGSGSVPSHTIAEQALTALCNVEYCGETGAPGPPPATAPASWGGSPTPSCKAAGFDLPAADRYAVGGAIGPTGTAEAAAVEQTVIALAAEEGLRFR
jgi:hypothetical protein